MTEQELEKRLRQLPESFVKTLSPWTFSREMRQRVYRRLHEPLPGRNLERGSPFPVKAVVAVFAVFFITGLLSGTYLWDFDEVAAPEFHPLEARLIDLDGRGEAEMVSTWKVKQPDGTEELLGLIWNRDRDGKWHVVFSYPVFPGEVQPMEIISYPGSQGNMVVLSVKDASRRLHYKVLGFDGERVLTFLEETMTAPMEMGELVRIIEGRLTGSGR